MDVVILCGGKGTRLSEETTLKAKPMVEIGNKPILWHIMKYYSSYGFNRFILALGYKAESIKEYFYNYKVLNSDFTIDLKPDSAPAFYNSPTEKDWEITFIDTGLETLKGGRIKRIEQYIKSESFHLTYGDGVGDVNLDELVKLHHKKNKIATVTAVRPPSRFGEMILSGNEVKVFDEKPQMHSGYINGGFFVLKRDIFSYLSKDSNCDFEFGPLQQLVKENQLSAFKHNDFWQCMDNVREKEYLNQLLAANRAPWVRW